MRVILLDNRDSFVYNLVDQFAVLGAGIEVYRNTVPAARVLKALEPTREESAHGERPVLALSPAGHPRTSGCLMELVVTALADSIPTLGICLGFQAIVEACGGDVDRVGPVHGRSVRVALTEAGRADAAFAVLQGEPLDVARYHSLGTRELPPTLTCLARTIEMDGRASSWPPATPRPRWSACSSTPSPCSPPTVRGFCAPSPTTSLPPAPERPEPRP